ncbi:hypothetical protein BH18ACI2_BH18ACI2_29040 [soil metagenome]
MKLSVALCTYNGAAFLSKQLESIAAQTRLPDELIVCDDCSTDDTRRIVEAFIARAPFPVRLQINEQNLGSTKNFEQAIQLCAGEIIALSDQDDVWRADKLRRIAEVFASAPGVGLVISDAELVDEELRTFDRRLWQETMTARERRLMVEGQAFVVLLNRNVVTGATMAFRSRYKDLFLPLPDDLFLIHDGWIALVIASVSSIALLDEPLVKYRQHSGQQLVLRGKDAPPPPDTPARRREYYSGEGEKLRRVRERLEAFGGATSDEEKRLLRTRIKQMREKEQHYAVRGDLPESRLARVSVVWRELRTHRYRRHSKGFLSAAKDLLR